MRRLAVAVVVLMATLPLVGSGPASATAGGDAPEIVTDELPDAHIGIYYAHRLQATGGIATDYYWNICVGWTPPDGMNIMPNGSLEGWPQPSLYGITLNICAQVSVQSGQIWTTKIIPLEVDVDDGAPPNPVIQTASLPAAREGQAYSFQLQATGDDGSGFLWLMCPGWALPAGLSLSSSGLISGTPAPNTETVVDVCVRVISGGSSGRVMGLGILDPGPRTWGVTIYKARFAPASLAIASRDWVKWTNRSGGRRTIETGAGVFVALLSPGEIFSHRLFARRVHVFRMRQTGQTFKVTVS